MADGRQPRPSTDEENAPLLQGDDAYDDAAAEPTFGERVAALASEPLTGLSRALLVLALILLILAATFIGLFAGAQHKLTHRAPAATTTVTATAPPATSIVTATRTTTFVSGPTGKPEVCLTADCVKLSAAILSSIDTTVDPCENFYEFTNNGWLREHPLPSDKGVYGAFHMLAKQNQRIIRELLEGPGIPASPSPAFTAPDERYADAHVLGKLRGLYRSCMAEDTLNALGDGPLRGVADAVRRLFRNNGTTIYAAADDEEKLRSGLTAAIAYLHSRGVPALFAFEVEGDAGVDPDDMSLWFSQPELGLPSKEYYEEKAIVHMYENVLGELLSILDPAGNKSVMSVQMEKSEDGGLLFESDDEELALPVLVDNTEHSWPPWPWPPWGDDDDGEDDGGDDDDKDNEPVDWYDVAKDVVKFEKALAAASLDLDVLLQDPLATYNPLPTSNLTASVPQIAFGEYFAAMTPRAYPAQTIQYHPAFAPALAGVLNATAPRTLEAYLVSRAALALAPLLGGKSAAWRAHRALVERLAGIPKGAVGARDEFCIARVEEAMGFAAGRYFANVTFGGASREKGVKVIEDITHAFKDSLETLEWMDKKSAKAAKKKADALTVKVGYPLSPNTRDARSIAAYYRPVEIDEDAFFSNMLNASASDVYREWQKLGKRRNKEEWLMWPSQVNAYYNPPGNEIVFPAGILQPPFFSQAWPNYLTYGAFGMVAAHELTHAFDSAGRLYNPHGKLEEWWTNTTSAGFSKRSACLADQYSHYYVEDDGGNRVYINGNLTSGENIGDSGLIQAYRAWRAQLKASSSAHDDADFLLPGLEAYSREQLFFIAFGRVWAQNIKRSSAVQRIRTDPHSPNHLRVDGTLYNVPEFAKAFKCKAKAKLNPPNEKRCLMW